MAPWRRSNPLALAVLCCLYERPMHPYEVAQTLRSRQKHESIRLNYGSLYGIVENLERGRLIAARETVREGKRPERTVYAITERGVRELVDWMSELVATPVKEYPQFEAALSLIHALPPDVAGDLLAQRVVNLDLILTQKRAALAATAAQGLPRLFVLETEYAIAMLAAERDLTDEIARAVADGTLDGIDEWRSWFASDSTAFDPEGAHVDDADGGPARSGVRAPWSDAAADRRQALAQVEDAVARTREEADELRVQAKRTKAAAKDVKAAAKAAVPRRSRRRPSDA
ncbi:PadR family transcriptional regulator [Iamia sp. SCSIO 61187]|uniref:PadR family transcriptional regulator n=1 Tax=Iamia sp. SCSIO 61187 TaxID=2722752 RepID=UPI001C6320D3|nr:PadR family transcriptional regulator [Iamia sp. SCSIO 61187]